MLEVGCAHGGFMRQMASRGWRVTGIEYSASAASRASAGGFPVHVGSLEEVPEMPSQFDLITAWMVVEHLHNPVEGLRKLRRWIRPDGWLAFSVPNAGAREFKWFGRNNFNLDVPRHLYHFTPASMAAVLERSGWSIERILHQRTMTSTVRSLGHVCEEKGWSRAAAWLHEMGKKAVITNALLYPVASCRAIMGQSDRITVWARPAA
jgi:2-polyprenyl-3-methyl-5-hydroxy-6-metoxy-1,4-benzoquinol methylase